MLDGLLQRLITRSFKRGLGGEPVWLAVGVAAWLVVRSRRKERPIVWSGRLEEGQGLNLRVRGSQVEVEPNSSTD